MSDSTRNCLPLADRIAACRRMEGLYRAERRGLEWAGQSMHLIIQYPDDPDRQRRFALGFEEGRTILATVKGVTA